MNEGYLEDGSVVQKDGITASTEANKDDIFKSNYSGGAWRYAGKPSDTIVIFGQIDTKGNMQQLLATGPAAVFKNKYEKTTSIKIENIASTKTGSGSSERTTDGGLYITFLDGAQN